MSAPPGRAEMKSKFSFVSLMSTGNFLIVTAMSAPDAVVLRYTLLEQRQSLTGVSVTVSSTVPTRGATTTFSMTLGRKEGAGVNNRTV
jgi:hypothetical protein